MGKSVEVIFELNGSKYIGRDVSRTSEKFNVYILHEVPKSTKNAESAHFLGKLAFPANWRVMEKNRGHF